MSKYYTAIDTLRTCPSLINVALEIEILRVFKDDNIHYRLEVARLFRLLEVENRAEYDAMIKHEIIDRMTTYSEFKACEIGLDWLIKQFVDNF